ncbi:3'(2'),5'-bisphosphate nucleotidase [Idiomarina tyrosinivorans]|uniref:3'(2'),5'-bisphosphate nucleotidase CysQ n=1 Tax=Idiomarina tyrosinivorans TaxID=1445662 RepID=A0A432ZQR9_9GAMM|nr:3'(2'),5'-bisphosphate nucleotidase CysQ [Idiomarina tyrosinivorans]RUO80192.1 3'(2'),5'-bisphosphate nucleotidase [Idiomarina tyrosinivorans]
MSRTENYLKAAQDIAKEAGALVHQLYDSQAFSTHEKADESPVTSADLAANDLIVGRLTTRFPEIPILSEESGHRSFDERQNWKRYWLIDPIDGTQEFIARSGDFAVNIAMVVDNQPQIGVIYWPAGDVLYYAVRGEGAFKESIAGREKLQVRQLQDPVNDPLIIAISRRQPRERVLQRMYETRELQPYPAGSCSLKACFIAEGKADCFLRVGPTGEWDTAAAEVIVGEAGGSIVNEHFDAITYNQTKSLLNPNFMVLGDPRVPWKDVFIQRPAQFR